MTENREEQVEALQALRNYNPKLMRAMENVANELSGNRLLDTGDYLEAVVRGMNWEIQILNGTKEFLEERNIDLKREEANQIFIDFSNSYREKDDLAMSEILRDRIIPYFQMFEQAAETACM